MTREVVEAHDIRTLKAQLFGLRCLDAPNLSMKRVDKPHEVLESLLCHFFSSSLFSLLTG
jgi:hypothetical protein